MSWTRITKDDLPPIGVIFTWNPATGLRLAERLPTFDHTYYKAIGVTHWGSVPAWALTTDPDGDVNG